MRRPDQQGQSRGNGFSTAWLPVLAALGIMVTGCLSTFIILQLDAFRPKVGDIVAFRPGSQDSDSWQLTIPATIVAGAAASCTLDPNVMATRGGSLIVERRQDEPMLLYRVHWAGTRTADAGADCGPAAELLVSRTDLQRLANAAGGFGVGDKGAVQ